MKRRLARSKSNSASARARFPAKGTAVTPYSIQQELHAETLRNASGVVLLKDRVLEAAYKACNAADPLTPDDGTCVREAVKSAQPQVDAAIAHARSTSVM
jgi:UrcA family protein